jgi:hypothetical protein
MTDSWNDFLKGVAHGNVPDLSILETKTAEAASKPAQKTGTVGLLPSLKEANKRATALTKAAEAHEWLHSKVGFIDASSLQGGAMPGGAGAPPADPSMMQGGGAPMDPSMMQGGGAPPMDPSMMQGGGAPMDPSMMQGGAPVDPSMMQGGAPPADPSQGGGDAPLTKDDVQQMINDALSSAVTGQAQSNQQGTPSKGKDAQQQLLNKTLRLLELINGLYNVMGLPIPPSVIDDQANAEAIAQQNAAADSKKAEGQNQGQDPNTVPGNPMINQIPALTSQKMGAAETKNGLSNSLLRSQALLDYLNKKV